MISIGKKKEWKERLSTLKDEINIWINKKTDKTIEVVNLYYDTDVE